MTIRIRAVTDGDPRDMPRRERARLRRAAELATREAARAAVADLRADTEAALGKRVSRIWTSRAYRDREPAALVWARDANIAGTHSRGATIRPRTGKLLALPTAAVIRREGRKVTPADFEEAGIPLRYVPPKGARRVGLLVADNFRVTARGRARVASARAQRTGRGVATVVMFVLVPLVRIRAKLKTCRIFRDQGLTVGERLVDALEKPAGGENHG